MIACWLQSFKAPLNLLRLHRKWLHSLVFHQLTPLPVMVYAALLKFSSFSFHPCFWLSLILPTHSLLLTPSLYPILFSALPSHPSMFAKQSSHLPVSPSLSPHVFFLSHCSPFLPFFVWTESQFELSEQMRVVRDYLNGHK